MKLIQLEEYRDCFVDDRAYEFFIRAMKDSLKQQDVIPVKLGHQIQFFFVSPTKVGKEIARIGRDVMKEEENKIAREEIKKLKSNDLICFYIDSIPITGYFQFANEKMMCYVLEGGPMMGVNLDNVTRIKIL